MNVKGSIDAPVYTTLDEKVSETILRDVRQVASKLQVVLMPREDREGILQKLKEWDLWGPLMVCLTLSIMLSLTAPEAQRALVFAGVFVIVWCGAAIVTLNAQLLGGTISFFQSVCILGYCVFPLDVACFVNLILRLMFGSVFLLKLAVVIVGFIWATRASVVFIAQIINPDRKVLAVYPVFFFYTFIAWMVLIQ
mmetsp:Transcript_30323/g.88297  ORF Transcript_30323/g.88297 Transcript_30323/m.88297 type:complete len:195 (-) Transcript_30323:474-1058(-)|eukprot:CAMPEP_0118972584 /NCGR_PEP_ID=MMETSP1173-20130426/8851_1 /TAXON_ID=1034831 /ORGANISM="Rhizochromulina marina cf, Strain CCMP1243" /LENGTH=194 /DNA_ID=CAMNT_0006922141 /DNA_START=60 /DNA_END=644 /DNA_ORIENTATION=+